MLKTFKVISWIEWASFILLLGAVINRELFNGTHNYVSYLGRAHGFLFVLYIILAYFLKDKYKWSNKNFILVCFMSVLPFGVFLVHKFMKSEE